ncbi:unnamed protein product [Leptidea sinapis]|uniref:C2H2-type domain-containing protein n=1 Tax=Leptidea sinapis TaxID=189913 RepID=A0A5E4QLG3_9NEOP|nr:unnamed protein product [Leptidea sinapis]
MSEQCNRYPESSYRDNVVRQVPGGNVSNEENVSLVSGFQKSLKVHVERLDITPYLNNSNVSVNTSSNKISPNLKKCSVKLLRDDLDQLKRTSSKNSRLNKKRIANGDVRKMNLKCKICEKSYTSEKRLRNHEKNKHLVVYKPHRKKRVSFSDKVIVHELREYHSCRKCPKFFESYNMLKLHMKQRHKKRKCYICNYCSKKFVDRMFFKVHIKLHCDICRQLLPNRRRLAEHRQNVCNIIKKYPCKSCYETYFRFMDLKDHMYIHLGTVFICDVCKDEFDSKCALAHHLKFLHSKTHPKRSYDMVNLGSGIQYNCNFCGTYARKKVAIEIHVSTLPDLSNKAMTGYEDYYFCDKCPKKFNGETDLSQHKLTHSLSSSANSQVGTKKKAKQNKLKKTYNINEKIPEFLQPKLSLEKLQLPEKEMDVKSNVEANPTSSVSISENNVKEPTDKAGRKKTILSNYQCKICYNYFSSKYCMNRHIAQVHKETYRCGMCEEYFAYESLLVNHRCLRSNIPEMPFDDARPEIFFDNLYEVPQHLVDDNEGDDYYNSLDIEIPPPLVELTEYDNLSIVVNGGRGVPNPKICVNPLQSTNKIVIQEVPVEF